MMEPNLIDQLAMSAELFSAHLAACSGAEPIATPDFLALARQGGTLSKPIVWVNDIFRSPAFRWAHVEFFSIPNQIGVIHVCVFPHFEQAAPIFGFDIIAGCSKATGAFLDLSPTVENTDVFITSWARMTDKDRADFVDRRDLPDWAAEIFSRSALAVRPDSHEEVENALALGRASLAMWLDQPAAIASAPRMKAAQQRYVEGQRRNQHTLRMLSNCVGPELAREFVDEWLFPQPYCDSSISREQESP